MPSSQTLHPAPAGRLTRALHQGRRPPGSLHVGLGLGGRGAYPGVVQPLGGRPAGCAPGDGAVRPADAPGFGLEQKPELRPFLARIPDRQECRA